MTIQPAVVTFDRDKAAELFRDYKKHLHYAKPIDHEIARAYELLSKGKLIIRAFESVKAAGLDARGNPVLALARGDWGMVFCTVRYDGSCIFSANPWPRANSIRYDLPEESFPRGRGKAFRAQAVTPIIPLHLRPKRGLQNYTILFEAEWTPVPPHDPLLLRRIGKSDLWLVVAQWDLSEIERAVLASRIRA